jgi:UDP-N-acetylglucosamine pyrophosphorylase
MQIKDKLKDYNQDEFVSKLNTLSAEEQKCILLSLKSLKFEKIFKKKEKENKVFLQTEVQKPLVSRAFNSSFGTLILAGGLGNRLNFERPKALVPLVEEMTLLDWHLLRMSSKTPVFLTTSDKESIETHLRKKNISLTLLGQTQLPLLNEKRQFFFINNSLAKGPNGNADALLQIRPYLNDFEHLVVIPIDNPFANPQDLELLCHHVHYGNEVTIKVIEEEDEKNMGLVVKTKKNFEIVEYSDPQINRAKKMSSFYNTGIYCLSTSFLKRLKDDLPYYWVRRNHFYKLEQFIFNHFNKAQKIGLQLDQRAHCFCPIKEQGDLKKVQEAIKNKGVEKNPDTRDTF